jgi:hypothetical protein
VEYVPPKKFWLLLLIKEAEIKVSIELSRCRYSVESFQKHHYSVLCVTRLAAIEKARSCALGEGLNKSLFTAIVLNLVLRSKWMRMGIGKMSSGQQPGERA